MNLMYTIGFNDEQKFDLEQNLLDQQLMVEHIDYHKLEQQLPIPQLVIIKDNDQTIHQQISTVKRQFGCFVVVATSNKDSNHRLKLMWAGADEYLLEPYYKLDVLKKTSRLLSQFLDQQNPIGDQSFKRELYNTRILYDNKNVLLKPKCYDLIAYRLISENSNITKQQLLAKFKSSDLLSSVELKQLIEWTI